MNEKLIPINITEKDLELIHKALGKMPYEDVSETIERIKKQDYWSKAFRGVQKSLPVENITLFYKKEEKL